jgi:vitamin B12/bleomycin/antimicrobial peptide transport system ATP-binding/permease protein
MNQKILLRLQRTRGLCRRYLLRRYWRSATGFWTGERRYSAWMLSAALLLVILLVVGAAYAMNAWNRAIIDSLQDRDTAAIAHLSYR